MATTLLQLRTRLNGEMGVLNDADTSPYPVAVRTQAIVDGFDELWRQGVWKPAKEVKTVSATVNTHALTSIRTLDRLVIVDTSGNEIAVRGVVEGDGTGGYVLLLNNLYSAYSGYTLNVYGWGPYSSVFASDAATMDLPDDMARIPLLKAQAILLRRQVKMFANYGSRQANPPEMAVSMSDLLTAVAAAEREFADACESVAKRRKRTSYRLTGA